MRSLEFRAHLGVAWGLYLPQFSSEAKALLGAAQGMSEVRKWLEAIGLGQYADAFETSDIDMDLIRQIDDQALKDLGMTSASGTRSPN